MAGDGRRPSRGALVVLALLLPPLVLLTAQFQIGCEGSCPAWRELVGLLWLPLLALWAAVIALLIARRTR